MREAQFEVGQGQRPDPSRPPAAATAAGARAARRPAARQRRPHLVAAPRPQRPVRSARSDSAACLPGDALAADPSCSTSSPATSRRYLRRSSSYSALRSSSSSSRAGSTSSAVEEALQAARRLRRPPPAASQHLAQHLGQAPARAGDRLAGPLRPRPAAGAALTWPSVSSSRAAPAASSRPRGVAAHGQLLGQLGLLGRRPGPRLGQLAVLVLPHLQLLAARTPPPARRSASSAPAAANARRAAASALPPASPQAQRAVQEIARRTRAGPGDAAGPGSGRRPGARRLLEQGQGGDQPVDQHPAASLAPQLAAQHQDPVRARRGCPRVRSAPRRSGCSARSKTPFDAGQLLALADQVLVRLARRPAATARRRSATCRPRSRRSAWSGPGRAARPRSSTRARLPTRSSRSISAAPGRRRRVPPQFSLCRMTR